MRKKVVIERVNFESAFGSMALRTQSKIVSKLASAASRRLKAEPSSTLDGRPRGAAAFQASAAGGEDNIAAAGAEPGDLGP
jgi:hypothetical protein